MALPLDRLRSIAQDHGYRESKLVAKSRVIIFQKDSTKVNAINCRNKKLSRKIHYNY